jgi:hypothetical protein
VRWTDPIRLGTLVVKLEPGAKPIRGTFRNRGGPLEIRGTITLSPAGRLHLHRARFASGHPHATIPSMKELLPQRAARRQFRLQFLSLVLLCAATLWPAMLTRPAALLLAVAFAEFGRLTVGTAWRYRRLARAAPA